MTRSISSGARPLAASALPPAATAMSTSVSSSRGPAALGDADPALDPLVVGVHDLGEIVVGHPPPGLVGAEAEDAGAGGAGRAAGSVLTR